MMSAVQKAVLSAIVIVVIFAVLFPPIIHSFKQILGVNVTEPSPPIYKGGYDMKIMECSLKALQLGGNVATTGDLTLFNDRLGTCGCSYDNRVECKKGRPTSEFDIAANLCQDDEVSFGPICIKCGESSKTETGVYCKVKGVTIPEPATRTIEKIQQLGAWGPSEIPYLNTGPDYIVYSGSFNREEGASWILPHSNVFWENVPSISAGIKVIKNFFDGVQDFEVADEEYSRAFTQAADINGIAVTQVLPFEISKLSDFFEAQNYPLEGAENYYPVSLVEHSGNKYQIPFYLASPCQTDVAIYVDDCTCDFTFQVGVKGKKVGDDFILYEKLRPKESDAFPYEYFLFDDPSYTDAERKELAMNYCNPYKNGPTADCFMSIAKQKWTVWYDLIDMAVDKGYVSSSDKDKHTKAFNKFNDKDKAAAVWNSLFFFDKKSSGGLFGIWNNPKKGDFAWTMTRQAIMNFDYFEDESKVDFSSAYKLHCYNKLGGANNPGKCLFINPYENSKYDNYNSGRNFCVTSDRNLFYSYRSLKGNVDDLSDSNIVIDFIQFLGVNFKNYYNKVLNSISLRQAWPKKQDLVSLSYINGILGI